MKKLLLIAALILSSVALYAKAPDGWLTDYDKALKVAKAENKAVYVLFTGSDWCGYCIKLRKNVLESARFKNFAKKHLVLVYCDFPRREKIAKKQLEKQQRWLKELKAGSGVPSAVIVSADGKVISRISGYADADVYISKLERIVK